MIGLAAKTYAPFETKCATLCVISSFFTGKI